MEKAYSIQSIQNYEATVLEKYAPEALLDAASTALHAVCKQEIAINQKVLLICGTGHNGADGLLLAVKLSNDGYSTAIVLVETGRALKPLTSDAADIARKAGIPFVGLEALDHTDVIIDGLLGIGFSGKLDGSTRHAIECINQSRASTLTIDVPSGLCADTGYVQEVAVAANKTLCVLGGKRGLYTHNAFDTTGEIIHADIDLQPMPPMLDADVHVVTTRDLLPSCGAQAQSLHKGDFGKVLVIGGAQGLEGSVLLAAQAASRCGVGHVIICTPNNSSYINKSPDFTSIENHEIDEFVKSHRNLCIILGPGLGSDAWAESVLSTVLRVDCAKVIDAGALRGLSTLAYHQLSNAILTPHPGEAAALLDTTAHAVSRDRYAATDAIQSRYGAITLLKGAGTIIHPPGRMPYVIHESCPEIAVAGAGDVLCGLIAAYVALGETLETATVQGALLHVGIGQAIREQMNGRGLMASDMIEAIPGFKNNIPIDYKKINNHRNDE
jgi:hydroxyethylthiazole kinase-like uncharacterized protein yjeF